jgi:hypothetical protein
VSLRDLKASDRKTAPSLRHCRDQGIEGYPQLFIDKP